MQVRLDRLSRGIPAIVVKSSCARRFRELGVVQGATVSVRYRSPSRAVMAVEVQGKVIAVRSRALKKVRVKW